MPSLVDFYLTDEQRAIQDLAHDFAKKEIRPIAMELDHKTDPAEAFFMPVSVPQVR